MAWIQETYIRIPSKKCWNVVTLPSFWYCTCSAWKSGSASVGSLDRTIKPDLCRCSIQNPIAIHNFNPFYRIPYILCIYQPKESDMWYVLKIAMLFPVLSRSLIENVHFPPSSKVTFAIFHPCHNVFKTLCHSIIPVGWERDSQLWMIITKTLDTNSSSNSSTSHHLSTLSTQNYHHLLIVNS